VVFLVGYTWFRSENSPIFSASRITSYTFEVCDSILNIGPCSQVAMGEPAFLSDEFSGSTKADPDVELVATSGK
jgi:cleavage and polyadenylation specificity factor subunit 1